MSIFFVMKLLLSCLMVTMGVVSLLVLLSNKLCSRPVIGFLITPIAGGAGLAVCNPGLVVLSLFITMVVMTGDWEGLLRDLRSGYLFPFCRGVFLFLGVPAAIFGAITGLMAYAGTYIWRRGIKRSRLQTMLGLLLILLTWFILGAGLAFEIFFLGTVLR